MDVTCPSIVGVAHEEIDVPHDGRLIRQIADIGGEIIVLGEAAFDTLELDDAIGGRRKPFDETLYLLARMLLSDRGPPIGNGDVVERVFEQRVGRGGNDDTAVLLETHRADAMMQQVLAREAVSETE